MKHLYGIGTARESWQQYRYQAFLLSRKTCLIREPQGRALPELGWPHPLVRHRSVLAWAPVNCMLPTQLVTVAPA
jgi:hypothetical protein